MYKKFPIGLIGKPGSGKETVGRIIADLYPGKVHHVTFSGPLTAFLLDMGYKKEDIDRPLLQLTAQMVNKHFGEGSVTRGALLQTKNSSAPIDIVDGVRWESDFIQILELESATVKPLMVYVSTSPEKRFERLRARCQRKGEDDLTWEKFLEQDNALNERFVEGFALRTPWHIDNNGTLEQLTMQTRRFCGKTIDMYGDF